MGLYGDAGYWASGAAWRGVVWRGMAWRGMAWRSVRAGTCKGLGSPAEIIILRGTPWAMGHVLLTPDPDRGTLRSRMRLL